MSRISRRSFLLGSAGAAAAAVAAAASHAFDAPSRIPGRRVVAPDRRRPRARVAVVRATDYTGPLEHIVADGLRAIGADVRGASVVLKPNLVDVRPGAPINTDPRLVAATVLAVRRLGARHVIVADGPGDRRDTRYVLATSGLAEALEAVDAPFVDLNNDALVGRSLRTSFSSLGSLWLPRTITDADVVVSMPKMKTHHWAGATLSLKNCLGCVPGRVYGWPKNVLHVAGIDRTILDVASTVRPRYAIVDGVVGMQGDGPIHGTPVRAGVLVFGDDPVATDTIGATLMGIDPERIGYLAAAPRLLGQGDREDIVTEGEDVDRAAVPFELIAELSGLRA